MTNDSPLAPAIIVIADQLYNFARRNWRWWHLCRKPKTPIDFIPAAREVVHRLMFEEMIKQ